MGPGDPLGEEAAMGLDTSTTGDETAARAPDLMGSATAINPARRPSTSAYTGVFPVAANRSAGSRSGVTSMCRSFISASFPITTG